MVREAGAGRANVPVRTWRARATWDNLDTRRIRTDNAPMKGKSRRERIASMSEAERDRLIPLARKARAEARQDALQVVVEAALAYQAEKEHEGTGHGMRMQKRDEELCVAIMQAVEGIKTGPLTEDDFLIALAMRDAQ